MNVQIRKEDRKRQQALNASKLAASIATPLNSGKGTHKRPPAIQVNTTITKKSKSAEIITKVLKLNEWLNVFN